jgi:hypothetical protein
VGSLDGVIGAEAVISYRVSMHQDWIIKEIEQGIDVHEAPVSLDQQ